MNKKIVEISNRDGKLYLDFGENVNIGETLQALISALSDTCDTLFMIDNNYDTYMNIKNTLNNAIDNVYNENNKN